MLHFVQPEVARYRSRRWVLDAKYMRTPLKSKGAQGGQASAPLSPSQVSPHTRKELLLTSAMQCALQHDLEAVDLERLPQGRPVEIGPGQFAIARGKDERRAAGNERIGNPRGDLAVEIGVENRNVEVGVLRRFQRLFDARGFGGDGAAAALGRRGPSLPRNRSSRACTRKFLE
jgi:hypothetical protein